MEALLKLFPVEWLTRAFQPAGPESRQFERYRGLVKKNHFRQKDEYQIKELRFVVLDTETTGFKPTQGDEILSVGAVVVKEGELRAERFHRLVNPHRSIPPLITGLTGISDDMAAHADDFCPVMVDFLEFLGDSIIVGHCIEFDLNFLNMKLGPYSFCINNFYLDTIILSKIININLRSHTLDEILDHMGVEPNGRHTAIGDALLTADIFLKFLRKLESQNVNTLWDLRTFIRHSMLHLL